MDVTLAKILSSVPTTFTAVTILLGIELLVLSSAWKYYKNVAENGPHETKGLKNRYLLSFLEIGCICIFTSIFLNTFALVVSMIIMLMIMIGLLQPSSLIQTRYLIPAGLVLFIIGLYLIGTVKLIEAVHWRIHNEDLLPLKSEDEKGATDTQVTQQSNEKINGK